MDFFRKKPARLRIPLALIIDENHDRYGQIGVNYSILHNATKDASEYQFYFFDGEKITILDDWQKPRKFINLRTSEDIDCLTRKFFPHCSFPIRDRNDAKKILRDYQ